MNAKSIQLIIESRMDLVPLVSKAVRAICKTVVKDDTLLYSLELCIFEAVMNVIEHSYHRDPQYCIEVIVMLEEEDIIFHVIDSGDKIFFAIPEQELNFDEHKVETYPESGMGLFLIHRIMDEVKRHELDGKNRLVMRKRINVK